MTQSAQRSQPFHNAPSDVPSRARSDAELRSDLDSLSSTASVPPTKYEFFQVIQGYLEKASRVVKMPDYVKQILSQPKNELIVHFPVRMDNNEFRLFKGYRI